MSIIKFPEKKNPKRRTLKGFYTTDNVITFEAPLPDVVHCPECGQRVYSYERKKAALRAWAALEKYWAFERKQKEADES